MLYLIYKFCILIDLDIILILYYYDFEEFSIILIEVSNVIMQIVLVFFKGFLCEMQLVFIVDIVKVELSFLLKCILVFDKVSIFDFFIVFEK